MLSTRSSSPDIWPRAALFLSTLVYGFAIHLGHALTLNPLYGFYGFTYKVPGVAEALLMIFLVMVGGAMTPSKLCRPSSIVVLLLFIIVYVPTVVITLGIDADRLHRYLPALLALAVAYSAACLGARAAGAHSTRTDYPPDDRFCWIILWIWAISCGILIYNFGSIMSFVGLGDIYAQRLAGASQSLAMGYLQVYFSNVLSLTLIAIGLVRSKAIFFALGVLGCLIMYMINAQRTVFLFPFIIFALYFARTSKIQFLRTSASAIIFVSGMVFLTIALNMLQVGGEYLPRYLLFRILGLPGLTFSQYYDVFSQHGFTWWSHVKGLNLLIAPPAEFLNDRLWPGLGYIVGDRVYRDPANNHVANLFVGDGIAAAGALGVITIGIVLALWLALLDRISAGWDKNFVILVIFPVGFSLTNGHMFTMLLSFGGLFWLLVFHFYKPRPEIKNFENFNGNPPIQVST